MSDALRRILTSKPLDAEASTLAAWWDTHHETTRGVALPVDRAIVAGAAAQRVAFAFASGYRAALEALVGDLPASRVASLCVTEAGGGHPRAIQTTLTPHAEGGFTLSGRKRWTTMASPGGGLLLVAASVGLDEAGRNRLKLVRVASESEGVTITPMPETPFIPEVPHAEVAFDGVRVREEDVLSGDGYEGYVKPFRTVEDIHVQAAVLAHLLGVARRFGWPLDTVESLAAVLTSLRALATEDPLAAEVHVALAGVLRLGRKTIEDARAHWTLVDVDTRTRWERDAMLLGIAEKARVLRLESAHRVLAAEAAQAP